MEGKELNKTLRDRARMLGLCDQWYDAWEKDETKQELIEKYLRGIDFCIAHDYPRLEFIKAHFPKAMLEKNGVFVDEVFSCCNTATYRTVVALGKSRGTLTFDGMTCRSVYARHHTEVTVRATDGAKVFVEAWEDCKVNAYADDESRVFVYWHGGEVTTDGKVTVRDKRKAE